MKIGKIIKASIAGIAGIAAKKALEKVDGSVANVRKRDIVKSVLLTGSPKAALLSPIFTVPNFNNCPVPLNKKGGSGLGNLAKQLVGGVLKNRSSQTYPQNSADSFGYSQTQNNDYWKKR